MEGKSVKFTILGSGSAVPFEGRASSSYFVETEHTNILLDCGFQCVDRLYSIGKSLDSVDYIFLSHKHPDHFIGLIHLFFALRSPYYERKSPICIFGFKDIEKYFEQFRGILGKWIEPGVPVNFFPNENNSVSSWTNISDLLSFRTFSTMHTDESVGVSLVVNERKIVYTSDTEFFEGLADEFSYADLAVVDCASGEGSGLRGHMDFRQGIFLAEQAGVKKLLFSHFYPDSINFDLSRFDTDIEFYKARDCMSIFL
jgi:ribonuclease BN (tRNA processing enzyme)